jgi:hypothetical protein
MRTQQDMDAAFKALAADRPDAVLPLGQPFVVKPARASRHWPSNTSCRCSAHSRS